MQTHQLIDIPRIATPELLPVVQYAIERILSDGKATVLEFGSGHSTVWLAGLGANVASVENRETWHDAVQTWLDERDLDAKLFLREPELSHEPAHGYKNECFDLVLVDGHQYHRMECIRASRDKVKLGGWLVLDDAQWPCLESAQDVLAGWARYSVSGEHLRKTGIRRYVRTDFYQRPEIA